MREDVNLVEIDLKVKKHDKGLKRHSNSRRSCKKKRMHSWTNPRMRSRRGDIERQRKGWLRSKEYVGRNKTYYKCGNVLGGRLGPLEISTRNTREYFGNLEPRA